MKTAVAALACCLDLVGLAACSDSSPSSAPPTTVEVALTHEEFVRAANALCVDQAARAATVPEPTEAAGYPAAMRQLIDNMKHGQDRWRELVPPVADRKAIEEFIAIGDRQIAALEGHMPEFEQGAATGDLAEAEASFTPAIEEYATIGLAGDPFAESYGLTDCMM